MIGAAESDEELMLRFGRGDVAAFELLYRRHELRVFRYLHRNVRNHATANDLMQDVWFAVARSAARYEPTARFTTWLFTVAHNRMVDWLRAARPHVRLDDPDEAAAVAEFTADTRPGPLASAQAAEHADSLIAAVGQLPPAQQQAFLLQVEGDLSVGEIAHLTGASFETTKSRLRYARTRLKQLLCEHT